ncbi:MAG TPA: hypothetical protein VLA55_01725 [Ornithinibacter sp.]|nr:hypothetical protein [Ornithinibacter sp.]
MTTEPITLTPPVAPDADWDTVRGRIVATLVADAAPGWTDHNGADPGITIAEAAAFGLADLHYRIAAAGSADWPLAWPGWLPESDRHWDATLPADPARLTSVATALAAVADTLEPLVRACASRGEALALVGTAPSAALVPTVDRPAVVALLRAGLLRQVAQHRADTVADGLDEAVAGGGTTTEQDARAVDILGHDLTLWPTERAALVRRERRRRVREAAGARATEILRASTPTDRAMVVARLMAEDGLTPAEADLATALAATPAGMVPEHLEEHAGASRIWPPHGIQALTCEPVTNLDYARRARQHPGVRRAWAVPGRLDGIAWHGLVTPVAATLPAGDPAHSWAIDPDAAAVTLVVEAARRPGDVPAFLREVLRAAIGTECGTPFPPFRDDLDEAEPHRVIGDEVGAALLATVEVTVRATLVIGAGSDGGRVAQAAGDALDAFFSAGRADLVGETVPAPLVDGPWPPAPQPSGGWVPGEPIRVSEVVEVLAGCRDVLGIREVHLRLVTSGDWTGPGDGTLTIPPGTVPVRVDDCFTVDLALNGGCGDA